MLALQRVPHPSNGLYVESGFVCGQPLPKAGYARFNRIWRHFPLPFEQDRFHGFAGNNASQATEKGLEQQRLASGQDQGPVTYFDFARRGIEGQVSTFQQQMEFIAWTPENCPYARKKFSYIERAHQIVIGTCIETLNERLR